MLFKMPEKGKVAREADYRDFIYRVLLPRHLKWKGASDLRQLICCVRRVQKLSLYTRCLLLIIVVFLLISIYQFFPVQISPGWVLPDSCTAESCQIMDPLPLSKISTPNLLFILIHASAGKRERRDAIRETWAASLNNPQSPVQYRFIIGGKNVKSSLMKEVLSEASEFNDILVFQDITDSVYSLTNRTLYSFKYAHDTFDFKYFLKCDDDSYVDVPRVSTELENRKSDIPYFWGYMYVSVPNIRGRYAEFRWYVCDSYVTYARGGGYVLSRGAASILSANAELLRRYTCEDVSMGSWLAPYNIERRHDARFNTITPSRGCKDPFIISHKVSPEWMRSLHESMNLEGKMCSWRTYSFGLSGYIYNWDSQPSSCCRRNSFVP